MRLANGLEEFYSRYKANGDFEYFVDNRGNYTIDYPHVHVVFLESKNAVVVIASQYRGQEKRWRVVLQDPDGNQVNGAIRAAIAQLNW